MEQLLQQIHQIKIRFKFTNGLNKDLFVNPDVTIQQLNNMFLVAIQYYLFYPFDYSFFFNGRYIDKNDQTKIKDYFDIKHPINILVCLS